MRVHGVHLQNREHLQKKRAAVSTNDDKKEGTEDDDDSYEVTLDDDFLTALEYGMPPASGMVCMSLYSCGITLDENEYCFFFFILLSNHKLTYTIKLLIFL